MASPSLTRYCLPPVSITAYIQASVKCYSQSVTPRLWQISQTIILAGMSRIVKFKEELCTLNPGRGIRQAQGGQDGVGPGVPVLACVEPHAQDDTTRADSFPAHVVYQGAQVKSLRALLADALLFKAIGG